MEVSAVPNEGIRPTMTWVQVDGVVSVMAFLLRLGFLAEDADILLEAREL